MVMDRAAAAAAGEQPGQGRRDLLDRTLIWNQFHLMHALREEFEQFYNRHRPHQGIANAGPLQPLPVPLVVPGEIVCL